MHRALNSHTGPAGNLLAHSCLLIGLLWLTACTSVTNKLDARAPLDGAVVTSLPGGQFSLYAVERTGVGRHARVFIEGDGRPWLAGGRAISDNPTPRKTPLLDWMMQTPGPALYLGRPCYFEQDSPACHPMLWTYSRYSETVLDSMQAALNHWLAHQPDINELTLIGHSGGGVLALLLAERIPQTSSVVAIATPLDIDRWAGLHGYGRLFDSINPAQQTEWRPDVTRQLLFGEKDSQVPAKAFLPAAQKVPEARVHVIENAEHACCLSYQPLSSELF